MGTDYVDQSLRVDSSAGETLQKTPSLAGHTLTFNQDSKTLILIGGYSPLSGFNHQILEYDLMAETWKNIPTSGFAPRGIYGPQQHTTMGPKLFIYLVEMSFMSTLHSFQTNCGLSTIQQEPGQSFHLILSIQR